MGFSSFSRFRAVFLSLICTCIVSCSGSNVINRGSNSFLIVSTGSKDYLALKNANNQASKFCKKKQEGKIAVVDSYDTSYKGAFSEQTNQMVDSISGLARAVDVYRFYDSEGDSISVGSKVSTRSSDDYQVKLNFHCE